MGSSECAVLVESPLIGGFVEGQNEIKSPAWSGKTTNGLLASPFFASAFASRLRLLHKLFHFPFSVSHLQSCHSRGLLELFISVFIQRRADGPSDALCAFCAAAAAVAATGGGGGGAAAAAACAAYINTDGADTFGEWALGSVRIITRVVLPVSVTGIGECHSHTADMPAAGNPPDNRTLPDATTLFL
jgi:hypothetical protein